MTLKALVALTRGSLFMFKAFRKGGFVYAACTSAVWRCKLEGVSCVRLILKTAWTIFIYWITREPTDPRWRDRLDICRQCVIYDSERQVCGRRGETVPGTKLPIGCSCYMPAKSRIPWATCWARNQGLEDGWPDRLNGLT